MRSNPYQSYLDDEILTADPIRLVQLLYRGALDAVADARLKLAEGKIRDRSRAITKAIEILAELSHSLAHDRGGDLSARLEALYDYMQRRLIEANQRQADGPLEEVERILGTLEEAWLKIEVPAASRPARGYADERSRDLRPHSEYVPLSCAC
jgi:flagellar protein FliS